LAIEGENKSMVRIANSNAALAVERAKADQLSSIAVREAEVEIQKTQYKAELERLNAEEIVQKEIEKRKIELEAQAIANKISIEAKGRAEAVLANYQAEADGIKKVLAGKAEGYAELLKSVNNDPKALATLLMVEKIEEIVGKQVEAIKNLKIDKITVWDSGSGNGDSSSTANFISSFAKSLPPLQDVASMAGVELPEYLGKIKTDTIAPIVEKTEVKKTSKNKAK